MALPSSQIPNRTTLRATDVNVVWLTALQIEYNAARQVLEEEYEQFEIDGSQGDRSVYTAGRVGSIYVAIAPLPEGSYGIQSAGNVIYQIQKTFPRLTVLLLVGVAGGTPRPTRKPQDEGDVRLGDVVVGTKIVPYSQVRALYGGREEFNGTIFEPSEFLRTGVTKVQSQLQQRALEVDFAEIFANPAKPGIEEIYRRPEQESDRLFRRDYHHREENCACESLDNTLMIEEPWPRKLRNHIRVHCGRLGSADQLLRDAHKRDRLVANHKILCVEMESAAFVQVKRQNIEYLPIRGICDYADSHKNKQWQPFAAAAAALFARRLLSVLPANLLTPTSLISEATVQLSLLLLRKRVDGVTSGKTDANELCDTIDEIRQHAQMLLAKADQTRENICKLQKQEEEHYQELRASQAALAKLEDGQDKIHMDLADIQRYIETQKKSQSKARQKEWRIVEERISGVTDDLKKTWEKTGVALNDAVSKLNEAIHTTRGNDFLEAFARMGSDAARGAIHHAWGRFSQPSLSRTLSDDISLPPTPRSAAPSSYHLHDIPETASVSMSRSHSAPGTQPSLGLNSGRREATFRQGRSVHVPRTSQENWSFGQFQGAMDLADLCKGVGSHLPVSGDYGNSKYTTEMTNMSVTNDLATNHQESLRYSTGRPLPTTTVSESLLSTPSQRSSKGGRPLPRRKPERLRSSSTTTSLSTAAGNTLGGLRAYYPNTPTTSPRVSSGHLHQV